MSRHRFSIALLLTLSGLLVGPAAHAENLAFQVVCKEGNGELRTPWVDERISRVAFFDRARDGIQYHYCRADCGAFGLGGCHFTPVGELGNHYPWTERRAALSCDEVCLHVRAVDGRMNGTLSNVDFTRYATTYTGFSNLSWWAQSHSGYTPYDHIFQHRDRGGVVDGYKICWRASWPENYWIARYGAPGSAGRKTVFTMRDSQGVDHEFTVGGYFHVQNRAVDRW